MKPSSKEAAIRNEFGSLAVEPTTHPWWQIDIAQTMMHAISEIWGLIVFRETARWSRVMSCGTTACHRDIEITTLREVETILEGVG